MKNKTIFGLLLATLMMSFGNAEAAVIATPNECKQLGEYAQLQRKRLGQPQGNTLKAFQQGLYNFYVSKSWLQRIVTTTPALQTELAQFNQSFEVAMNATGPNGRFDIMISMQSASVRTLNLAIDSIITNYCTNTKTFLSPR